MLNHNFQAITTKKSNAQMVPSCSHVLVIQGLIFRIIYLKHTPSTMMLQKNDANHDDPAVTAIWWDRREGSVL